MAKLARRSANGQHLQPSASVASAGVLAAFPALCEFVSLTTWEDGQQRQTGTVLLLTDSGSWKVWLHDRELGQGLFVTGPDVDGVLLAAEEALESGKGDWRADKGKGKR